MKSLFLKPIKAYQFVSQLLPASCRYYPSCSEYASWQFEFNRGDRAFVKTAIRILKCNQLFAGGIDYPLVKWSPKNISYQKIEIKYWIIPKDKNNYYIVKDFDFIKRIKNGKINK